MENTLQLKMEYLFNSLMNLNLDSIVIVDLDGRVLEVNDKFVEMHGWSREEAIGMIMPMIPDEFKEEAVKQFQNQSNRAGISGIEMLGMRKDGSSFFGSVTISPVKDDEGKIIAYIGAGRDISEQKIAEKELLEREFQFRKLIQYNPEPIMLHKDGIVEFINFAGRKLLGDVSSNDVEGRPIFDFFDSNETNKLQVHIEEVVKSDSFTDFFELHLCKSDRTILDVEVSSVYIYKNMGRPIIQTVIRDLTERKKAEELMIRSEKLSIIGQLAAGIAHDIRNPVTSLKGFLQLLITQNVQYTEIMMEELEHINNVVNEFMTLAKPHINIYKEEKVSDMVGSVIVFLQPQALLYNAEFYVQLDADIPSVYCISDQIKQVLINVLKNAIEAMPDGGLITISIKNYSNQSVLIRVADQGIGIPEEELSNLGEPFFTLKSNGTGLGWMISQHIIDEHEGQLLISSKVNQGTTVDIILPTNKNNYNE
jgi:two-component system sporulation sensor kinase A